MYILLENVGYISNPFTYKLFRFAFTSSALSVFVTNILYVLCDKSSAVTIIVIVFSPSSNCVFPKILTVALLSSAFAVISNSSTLKSTTT